jgi:hypothetical protein
MFGLAEVIANCKTGIAITADDDCADAHSLNTFLAAVWPRAGGATTDQIQVHPPKTISGGRALRYRFPRERSEAAMITRLARDATFGGRESPFLVDP